MADYKSVKSRCNPSLNLLGKRLGLNYNQEPSEIKKPEDLKPHISSIDVIMDPEVTGVDNQRFLLDINGGTSQQDRMIFDKRRTLDRVLKYSYQACDIRKVSSGNGEDNTLYPNIHELDEHHICRALINIDRTKVDYDDKMLSVHYEENYHPGDVFEWMGTNTYWLIYLQDLTERAYFRGEIRKCDYQITWQDDNGEHSNYIAVRGPVETKIDYIQKHGISIDNPNHSLHILMPRTKESLEYFRRYSKFYLQDEDEGAPLVCWRVEATDWISTPGILEITAVEYFVNDDEDDLEKKIAGALKTKKLDPNPEIVIDEDNPDAPPPPQIDGETFIKPKRVYEYHFINPIGRVQTWSVNVDSTLVTFNVNPKDPLHIKLRWNSAYSGQFVLSYGSYTKIIVVESLM